MHWARSLHTKVKPSNTEGVPRLVCENCHVFGRRTRIYGTSYNCCLCTKRQPSESCSSAPPPQACKTKTCKTGYEQILLCRFKATSGGVDISSALFFPSNAFMASARSFNTFNCMLQIGLQGLISAYTWPSAD